MRLVFLLQAFAASEPIIYHQLGDIQGVPPKPIAPLRPAPVPMPVTPPVNPPIAATTAPVATPKNTTTTIAGGEMNDTFVQQGTPSGSGTGTEATGTNGDSGTGTPVTNSNVIPPSPRPGPVNIQAPTSMAENLNGKTMGDGEAAGTGTSNSGGGGNSKKGKKGGSKGRKRGSSSSSYSAVMEDSSVSRDTLHGCAAAVMLLASLVALAV